MGNEPMQYRQITVRIPEVMATELLAANTAYHAAMAQLFDETPEVSPTDTELWTTVVEAEQRLGRVLADSTDFVCDEDDGEQHPIGTALGLASDLLVQRADVGGSFIRADAAVAARRQAAMGR